MTSLESGEMSNANLDQQSGSARIPNNQLFELLLENLYLRSEVRRLNEDMAKLNDRIAGLAGWNANMQSRLEALEGDDA